MRDPKTVPTRSSVEAFLAGVADAGRRADCERLCRMMRDATGEPPALWGPRIVGFGSHHYRYASGREGDTPLIGFSPRAQNLTLYLTAGLEGHKELLARLGKHKTGKGCLYVKRLADVDQDALAALVHAAVARARALGAAAP